MKFTVLKFGGSTLSHPSDILRIINISLRKKYPVIVVSAIYGQTEKLTQIVKNKGDQNAIQHVFSEIDNFTKKLINIIPNNCKLQSNSFLHQINTNKKQLLKIITNNKNPYDAKTRAQILSFGERFAAIWVAFAFQANAVDCKIIWPDEVPLLTTDDYLCATAISIDNYCHQNKNKFENQTTIVPGFYGVNSRHETTLFGRGGSDYSASILAQLLNARSLHFYKDLGGYRSADPKMVQDTRNIPEISLKEAREIANCGSKILHINTFTFHKNNPLNIKLFNFNTPHKADTIITFKPKNFGKVLAIVCADVSPIEIKSMTTYKSTISLIGNNIKSNDKVYEIVKKRLKATNSFMQSNLQFKNPDCLTFTIPKRQKITELRYLHTHLIEKHLQEPIESQIMPIKLAKCPN